MTAFFVPKAIRTMSGLRSAVAAGGRVRWLRGLLAGTALLVSAGTARADDMIFWTTGGKGELPLNIPEEWGAIRVGNLDGSGTPRNLGPNYAKEDYPEGIALDPSRGLVYWTTWRLADDGSNHGEVRVGNIDGSGEPRVLYRNEKGPGGIVVDAIRGKLYWITYPQWKDGGVGEFPAPITGWNRGAIRVGNTDGSGEARDLGAAFGLLRAPGGLSIDPEAGKIYFSECNCGPTGFAFKQGNFDPTGAIWVGNLDGSGTPKIMWRGEPNPSTPLIDKAKGKIYWTNSHSSPEGYNAPDQYVRFGKGTVRVANLDGSGEPRFLGPGYGSGESGPYSAAMDPDEGKIYWSNALTGEIRVGNLDGSGKARRLGPDFKGEETPHDVVILRAPVGTSPPVVRKGSDGSLVCAEGGWGQDLLGALLYRAPQTLTYSWYRNDKLVPNESGVTTGRVVTGTRLLDPTTVNAIGSSYKPTAPGSYSCRVTAKNYAGEAIQQSGKFRVD